MSSTLSLYEFLLKHSTENPVSFHMPGHKGSRFYRDLGYDRFIENLVDFDITEIPGADNLFQAETVIKSLQENYSKLYNCKKSYVLINGSSGGNIAAILASVSKNGKLILARNCHKSVFNALVLGDISPVYIYPETIDSFGISGEINPLSVNAAIVENPEAEAVFITSPNYYGICSDIKAISEIAHSYGKVLIVDEAHGAHLHFSEKLPPSAISSGADLVINSTHKTLASFTQSAVLNYNTELVDHYDLEDKLQMIQSTSPSYILMASLDINAKILTNSGKKLMEDWIENLKWTYSELSTIQGLSLLDKNNSLDFTKINFSMKNLGLTGAKLDTILIDDYNIYCELSTGNILMAMTGIGNKKEDYIRLVEALNDISHKHIGFNHDEEIKKPGISDPPGFETPDLFKKRELFPIPISKKRIPLKESVGCISGGMIIPYPPGIPIICPGEKITLELIEYIIYLRNSGEKVIGVNDFGEVVVAK